MWNKLLLFVALLGITCLYGQTDSGYLVSWGRRTGGPFPQNIVKISSGYYHSVALTADGSLAAWGDNATNHPWGGNIDYGRCNVPAGNDFIDVSASSYISAAVKSDGSIVTWGGEFEFTIPGNSYKAVSVNSYGTLMALCTNRTLKVFGSDYLDGLSIFGDDTYTAIDSGEDFFVALKADGSLWQSGALPGGFPFGNDYVAIDAEYQHCLALKADGSIVAWGSNEYGVCDVPPGNDFVAIAAGGIHNVALKADGSLVAWGYNEHGECSVPGGNDYSRVFAGGCHFFSPIKYYDPNECNSFAIKSNGEVVTWGSNTFGQLNLPQGDDFVKFKTGSNFNLALRADSTLIAWGTNNEEYNAPAGHNYIDFGVGDSYGIALKADGSLIVWWSDNFIGFNLPTDNDFIALSVRNCDNLALKSDGSVISWGLGIIGFITYQPTGSPYTAIQASDQEYSRFAGYALTADGAVYKLQNGNAILIGTGFKDISDNYALRTDGSIYSLNGNDYSDTPGGSGFIKVVGSEDFGLALKSDGSAIGWGANNYHQCDVPICNDYLDINAGCVAIVGSKDYHYTVPTEVSLVKAYPNPVRSSGNISFEIGQSNNLHGELAIYNIKGQKVRTFKTGYGALRMLWNCKDESNNNCASGVYFYKLILNGQMPMPMGKDSKSIIEPEDTHALHYKRTGKLVILK